MLNLALIVAAVLVILYIVGCVKGYILRLRLIAPGKELRAKFKSLGDANGKTKTEIESVIGPPFAVSIISGTTKTLYHWTAGNAHLMLDFDGDTCTGAHEYYAWMES